mmetsp:Transcript_17976/g.20410  ORF Transcript_17976/g.20410 Transcript_17976/m.20410 type:complete len:448 (-) Transcript_17976:1019-2362(-)
MAWRKLEIVFACLGLIQIIVHASITDDIKTKLNTFLSETGQEEFFSAVQLSYLSQSDKSATTISVGTVALNSTQPIDNSSLFGWGSITKEFTTSLLMDLESAGKLTMTDTLKDTFPEFFSKTQDSTSGIWPRTWASVTLYQLLNMTSGIPSYGDAIEILLKAGILHGTLVEIYSYPWTPQDLIKLSAEITLEFPKECLKYHACTTPGSTYHYSNTDYIIAGLIATKLNPDQSLQELFQKSIFSHLGAEQFAFFADATVPQTILDKMPRAYTNSIEITQPSDVTDVPWYAVGAAGGLIGSTETLVHLIRSFWNGQVVNHSSMEQFYTNYFVNVISSQPETNLMQDCPKGCYGLGVIALSSKEFGLIYFYRGQPLGYRTVYLYLPCSDFTIALAINSANTKSTEITTDMALEILGDLKRAKPHYFRPNWKKQFCPQPKYFDEGFLSFEF